MSSDIDFSTGKLAIPYVGEMPWHKLGQQTARAVNAVSYYVDHVRPSATDRLDRAWFGAGNALKDRAWTIAVSMVDP